jgi:hypothetical protein
VDFVSGSLFVFWCLVEQAIEHFHRFAEWIHLQQESTNSTSSFSAFNLLFETVDEASQLLIIV